MTQETRDPDRDDLTALENEWADMPASVVPEIMPTIVDRHIDPETRELDLDAYRSQMANLRTAMGHLVAAQICSLGHAPDRVEIIQRAAMARFAFAVEAFFGGETRH